jgi:hypothetical protein
VRVAVTRSRGVDKCRDGGLREAVNGMGRVGAVECQCDGVAMGER